MQQPVTKNAAKLIQHRFLHWLLVDPTDGVIRFATEKERPAIEAVANLHERAGRATDCEEVSADEWVSVRNAADAAAYAADAAADAAAYAADAAADAAAYAADAAAYAADAAADAAYAAAYAAYAAADAAAYAAYAADRARNDARRRHFRKLIALVWEAAQ